jgi:signal peptidase I
VTEGESRKSETNVAAPDRALTKLLKDYFFAIAGAALVATLVRVYVTEPFRIPGDFMEPMLRPGDHIFVNKLAYGWPGVPATKLPERGDVVIFTFANDPSKDFIKRVIAVGGDTVEIKNNQVILNDKPISRSMEADVFEETIEGRHYYVTWKGAAAESRRMTRVTVPKDQIFVLGDNRAKGQDSRGYGFLPVGALKGRASVVWFSRDPTGTVRWSRMMKKVQ